MSVSLRVINEMKREMERELKEAKVDIPNVDMSKLTEALAKGICNGLEKWEEELWRKLRG